MEETKAKVIKVPLNRAILVQDTERLLESIEKIESKKHILYVGLLIGLILSVGLPAKAQGMLLGIMVLVLFGGLAYKSPEQIQLEQELKVLNHAIDLMPEPSSEENTETCMVEVPSELLPHLPIETRFHEDLPGKKRQRKGRDQGGKRNQSRRQDQKGQSNKPKDQNQKNQANQPKEQQEEGKKKSARRKRSGNRNRKPRNKQNES